MDREYRSLLSLLDDENEQAAALAMAELLRRDEKQLEPVLRKLQETTNPRLRKRIHQLQSTILLRRRRRNLTARLFGEKAFENPLPWESWLKMAGPKNGRPLLVYTGKNI